ncbi:MAG: DUF488 domain-containing protein [Chloroflexi bacterium]|nr:DUF488 domain-containing protein [Chloroflexota bacterium]
MTEIFTIGHSNHDILDFLNILSKHGIRVLVDVRSDPYSRYASQFNKSDFQRHVTAAGIEYRYSGASIGGKPKDTELLTPSGKPDYDKLAATEAFQNELRAIVDIAETKRVVIMCSEADPAGCHRERIIAQVLRSWGVEVKHIMPDGSMMKAEQQGLF